MNSLNPARTHFRNESLVLALRLPALKYNFFFNYLFGMQLAILWGLQNTHNHVT
jgi:hypothetical protein